MKRIACWSLFLSSSLLNCQNIFQKYLSLPQIFLGHRSGFSLTPPGVKINFKQRDSVRGMRYFIIRKEVTEDPSTSDPFSRTVMARLPSFAFAQSIDPINFYCASYLNVARNTYLGLAFDLSNDLYDHFAGLVFLKTPFLFTLSYPYDLLYGKIHRERETLYSTLLPELFCSKARVNLTTSPWMITPSSRLQGVADLSFSFQQGPRSLTGHLMLPIRSFNLQFDLGYEKSGTDPFWKWNWHDLRFGFTLDCKNICQLFGNETGNDGLFQGSAYLLQREKNLEMYKMNVISIYQACQSAIPKCDSRKEMETQNRISEENGARKSDL